MIYLKHCCYGVKQQTNKSKSALSALFSITPSPYLTLTVLKVNRSSVTWKWLFINRLILVGFIFDFIMLASISNCSESLQGWSVMFDNVWGLCCEDPGSPVCSQYAIVERQLQCDTCDSESGVRCGESLACGNQTKLLRSNKSIDRSSAFWVRYKRSICSLNFTLHLVAAARRTWGLSHPVWQGL